MNRVHALLAVAVLALAILSFSCRANNFAVSETSNPAAATLQVQVTPAMVGLLTGQTRRFTATVTGTSNSGRDLGCERDSGRKRVSGQDQQHRAVHRARNPARRCAFDHRDGDG